MQSQNLIDRVNTIVQFLEQAEVHERLNRLDQAAHYYHLALAESPNDPECLLRLASLLLRTNCLEEAFHHIRHFLRIVNDLPFAYYLAGHIARELGRWTDSRSYLLRAVELDPSDLYVRVLCSMWAFTICISEAEVISKRKDYCTELEGLISSTRLDFPESINNAFAGISAMTPFFLPYLGSDIKELQSKYGAWICAVMAAKYPQFAQPLQRLPSIGRIKIGIVSNYFQKHSHWKIAIKSWLEQLDHCHFSIHCFHTGNCCDEITEHSRSIADSFLQSTDIETLAPAIYEHKLDVILYSGIGMDTNTMMLGGLRLAPVQCTSWGHPVTTGMATIDYFLSSDLMEPADGAAHYTEKLIRLPNISIYTEPVEPIAVNQPEFEIPGAVPEDVIFLCSQNLFKYLPQFDHIYPEIARQAPQARFVFIQPHVIEFAQRFKARLERAFSDYGLAAADHLSFVPELNERDYARLNARVDIYLDSIEWSGGNTTLESLPYNKPIVTLPGRFMRGRHTYAILKMMDVEQTIASTIEEYIAISVRLGQDHTWRATISEQIARNKYKIYRDRTAVAALEHFLISMSGIGNTDET